MSDGFLRGQWFTDPLPVSGLHDSNGNQLYFPGDTLRQIRRDVENSEIYTRMTPSQCLKAYAKEYIYDGSDVVLLTSFPTINNNNVNGTCPNANERLYTTSDGRKWQLYCNQGFLNDAFDLPQPNGAQSITECTDLCAGTPQCVASFWDPSATFPNCYPKSGLPVATNQSSNYQTSILVADSAGKGFNSSVLGTTLNGFWPGPYRWLCPQDLANWDFNCRQEVLGSPDNWQLPYFNHPRVERCYSRKMKQQCRLGFSPYLMIVVVVFNFLKVACFVAAYVHLRAGKDRVNPLLFTADDAIASFLRIEDPETEGICLAEKRDFENGLWDQRWIVPQPIRWRPVPRRSWFRAIGLWRFVYHILLLVFLLVNEVLLLTNRQVVFPSSPTNCLSHRS